MELNVQNKSLKYFVNGTDQGIAFDAIKSIKNKPYHLAIFVCGAGSVQLLHFQQKNAS